MSNPFGAPPPIPNSNPFRGRQRAMQAQALDQIKQRLKASTAPPSMPEPSGLGNYGPPTPFQENPKATYAPQRAKTTDLPDEDTNFYLPERATNFKAFEMNQAPKSSLPATPQAQSPIQDMIVKKAQMYGIDPRTALGVAFSESSFDPTKKNKESSAGGLYQFTDDAWKQFGNGDRFDPVANAEAGMKMMKAGQDYLKERGIDPTPEATYLTLFMGIHGAADVLSNPKDLVSKHLSPKAVEVNNLEGKTGQDMLSWAAKRIDYSGATKQKPTQLAGD